MPDSVATRESPATGSGWQVAGGEIGMDRPVVLGILNVTPDSFSDGGRYEGTVDALDHALEMVEAGADLVDVGGESSRPGAEPVATDEEWRRIGAVVDRLAREGVSVSVDTTKSEVARRALDAGAVAINDISGLRFDPEVGQLAADYGAGLILMHMRGEPRTMQSDLGYDDLIGEVNRALAASIEVAVSRGCEARQVVVDPGIGFGKSLEGNLELIARLDEFDGLGRPILIGTSRKSFLGTLLDAPPDMRLEGTIASCVFAFTRGASLFRVHDVGPVRRALDVAHAIGRFERRQRK